MEKLFGFSSSFSWHFKHFDLINGYTSFEYEIVCAKEQQQPKRINKHIDDTIFIREFPF